MTRCLKGFQTYKNKPDVYYDVVDGLKHIREVLPEVNTDDFAKGAYIPDRADKIERLEPFIPYGAIGKINHYCGSCGCRVDEKDDYCRKCGKTFLTEDQLNDTDDIGGGIEEEHALDAENGDLGEAVQET